MWAPTAALVAVVLVVAATGVVTVGLVTTGSMEPKFPKGSIIVALPGDPQVGDVVVYKAPDGAKVVHRVVARTDEGLITQGDANLETDQAAGIPPVDPTKAREMPVVNGVPLALRTDAFTPLMLVALQVGLLAVGIQGVMASRRAGRRVRVRPWHLFIGAAVILMAVAPFYHQDIESKGNVVVSAWLVPMTARITSAEGSEVVYVPAMAQRVVEAEGPVEVVRAPAAPGAAHLSQHGAVWAMLPAAAIAVGLGVAVRRVSP